MVHGGRAICERIIAGVGGGGGGTGLVRGVVARDALRGRLATWNFHFQSASPCRGYASSADEGDKDDDSTWEELQAAGIPVNPCNSPQHPAALAGVPLAAGEMNKSIQESYDAHSLCFVCGNAHPDGLNLKSFRSEEDSEHPSDLRSVVTVSDNYQGLPAGGGFTRLGGRRALSDLASLLRATRLLLIPRRQPSRRIFCCKAPALPTLPSIM